jgi:hypothetical protein
MATAPEDVVVSWANHDHDTLIHAFHNKLQEVVASPLLPGPVSWKMSGPGPGHNVEFSCSWSLVTASLSASASASTSTLGQTAHSSDLSPLIPALCLQDPLFVELLDGYSAPPMVCSLSPHPHAVHRPSPEQARAESSRPPCHSSLPSAHLHFPLDPIFLSLCLMPWAAGQQ